MSKYIPHGRIDGEQFFKCTKCQVIVGGDVDECDCEEEDE